MNAKIAALSNRLKADIHLHYQDTKLIIVVMNGTAMSGKDTFVKLATKCIHGYYKASIIDWVKDKLNVTDKTQKTKEVRKRLSDHLDANIELAYSHLFDNVNLNARNLVFVDIREPYVINRFVHDCEIVLKVRPITVHVNRNAGEDMGNHADQNTKNYIYDVEVDNNGTLDQLKIEAIKFRDKYLI
jgi:hypothetical protein